MKFEQLDPEQLDIRTFSKRKRHQKLFIACLVWIALFVSIGTAMAYVYFPITMLFSILAILERAPRELWEFHPKHGNRLYKRLVDWVLLTLIVALYLLIRFPCLIAEILYNVVDEYVK